MHTHSHTHTCTHYSHINIHTHVHILVCAHVPTHSSHYIDSSIRNFVQVTSNVESSTLTCNFTNELDRSRKSCNVTYGQCGQQPSQSAQGGVSSEETNIVRVQLDLSDTATYCYAVRARNGTYTVFVEGNLTTTGSE